MKKKLAGPPAGVAWVWQTLALKTSAAWLHRSHRAMLVTEFLEVENMRHAGLQNGNLIAPHRQLLLWGLRGETVAKAIKENIDRGLVVRTGGGGADLNTGKREAYRHRLTYLPTVDAPATNEWKRYKRKAPAKSPEKVAQAKRANAVRWASSDVSKKQKPASGFGSQPLPVSVAGENENAPISAKNPLPVSVAGDASGFGSTIYISGVSTPGEGEELPTAGTTCPVTMAEYSATCIGGEGLPIAKTACAATFADYADPGSAEIRRRFDAATGSRRAAA